MTPKFKKEANRLLRKYHYCPHPSCKEHFDTDYDLAKHIIENHKDVVDMVFDKKRRGK
jgi:hypothetical protein